MHKLRRLIIAIAVAALLIYLLVPRMEPKLVPNSILVLDLAGEYVESAEPAYFSRLLARPRRPFVSLLSEIAKAERDERLAAVIFRVRGLEVGWGKAQEIREAIARLAARGRRAVAYLELASSSSNLDYYVASAAPEIYASPATRAPLAGLGAEFFFLGGFWDLLGVEFEVERIGRYKTAADTITGHDMSEANREMADALLDSINAQFIEGIATSRALSSEAVRAAIDAAPFEPQELLAHRLIDGTLFFDELVAKLGDGQLVEGAKYAGVDPTRVGFDPVARFALIYGSGAVVTGSGSSSPTGSPVLAADTVSKALDAAANASDIDAIIFRVDSPGGSPLASDIVWRAAERAKQRGKPLIASFSDVAASGGYYAAVAADAIVASPASITGSIGVFVLRPVLGGLLEKLGIGFTSLTRGAHADLQLSTARLSDASRERLRAEVSSIYALFVDRVATGRGLDSERVDAVARGRVWTGAQAAERSLVDELGGLHTATRRAKQALDLDVDADVELVVYPQPRSLVEQLAEVLRGARAQGPPGLDAERARDLEPWLRAALEGGPAALLPFRIDVR